MITKVSYGIVISLTTFFMLRMAESADPKQDVTHKEKAVVKYDENFKGSLNDLVDKEIEVIGGIFYDRGVLGGKPITLLSGKWKDKLFIPNWGEVWQGKNVRIIGKISAKSPAEHREAVGGPQPAMPRRDSPYFYLTIRQIELLETDDDKKPPAQK